MRILELPRAIVKRGGRLIATELEGSLPYDVEQATVDAQTIRTGDVVELLAVAIRTERLKAFVELLGHFGLNRPPVLRNAGTHEKVRVAST